jgi:hypothetical protein
MKGSLEAVGAACSGTHAACRRQPPHAPAPPLARPPGPRPRSQPASHEQRVDKPHPPPARRQAAYNKDLKDWYAAYNKPVAVKDWLEHHPHPKEDWVLLLDSDMLLRRPFRPRDFNLTKGWAIAGHYDYMKVR